MAPNSIRGSRRDRFEDLAVGGMGSLGKCSLPEPWDGSSVIKVFTPGELPTAEALADVLRSHGVDTKDWGEGTTKDVSKYWKEIHGSEAGLEIWQTKLGVRAPVRVTHVLRAKVTSPDARARNVFLFNTWQQFGDGRKRTRNGLLSEKLTLAEMPLINHLHDVCTRAVTEEEMQRVVPSSVRISTQQPAPEYDVNYRCPLTVVGEEFIDHTIEVEASKSYPGLTTAYHLYTVDIICEGLPSVDFNTLEFEAPDKAGHRKLKYIHAWVWLELGTIQRYLFEGSELQERKSKGSFASPDELTEWLRQFDVDVESWGEIRPSFGNQVRWKSVEMLWRELESSQTQLERWGRHDGVPLLMRVVHVLQLKVTSEAASREQKFLFQVSNQDSTGQVRHVYRTMAKKMGTDELPFDAPKFERIARSAVSDQLCYLADVHVRLVADSLPTRASAERSGVSVEKVEFSDHRFALEDSPSYKNMTTMYHLYTVEVECTGLPASDFATLSFDTTGVPSATGWRWVTWQETLDILHQRAQLLERQEALSSERLRVASEACGSCLQSIPSADMSRSEVAKLKNELKDLLALLQEGRGIEFAHTKMPPSMVSHLADQKGVSDHFLNEAQMMRQSGSARIPAEEDMSGMHEIVHCQGNSSWCGMSTCFHSISPTFRTEV